MNCYPWHQPQMDRLLKGNFQSLLLVSGPGQGVDRFAQALTEHLMCQTQNACGQCQSCQWIEQGGHPDVFAVRPEGAAHAHKIDAMREIAESAHTTTHQGGRRVVQLFEAERMNRAGANGLLKVLEEPPASTRFVLTSTLPGSLPATILSRCRQVRLPSAPEDLQWLDDLVPASPERDQALLMTQAPDTLLHLLQHPDELAKQVRWRTALIDALAGRGDLTGLVNAAKPLALLQCLDVWYQVVVEQAKTHAQDAAVLKRFVLFQQRLQRERQPVLEQVALNGPAMVRALGGLWLRVAPPATTH